CPNPWSGSGATGWRSSRSGTKTAARSLESNNFLGRLDDLSRGSSGGVGPGRPDGRRVPGEVGQGNHGGREQGQGVALRQGDRRQGLGRGCQEAVRLLRGAGQGEAAPGRREEL